MIRSREIIGLALISLIGTHCHAGGFACSVIEAALYAIVQKKAGARFRMLGPFELH
jgi:hypothetical protein